MTTSAHVCNSILLGVVVLIGAGCGGGAANTSDTGADQDLSSASGDGARGDGSGGVQMEGLLGTISQEEVQRVFGRGMDRLMDCYSDAVDELEEIEGSLQIALQIDPSGRVAEAYIQTGDLGSIEAETCMMKKIEQFLFSREGNGMALVTYPLTLEAPYDPPEPISLDDTAVGEVVEAHREEIDRCLNGKSGVKITLYVGSGGRVLSAGAAADSYDGYGVAPCLAQATRGWSFSDPGKNLAKISIDF